MNRTTGHHTRVNTGWLANAERRGLVAVAGWLPLSVNSDHLTLLALLAMVGAGLSFWAASVWPPALAGVVVCLAANWFGDSLDGTLARVRKQERPRYGFYVDHVLDVTGTTCLLAGMGLSGFMSPVSAAAVLAAYLLVSSEVFLATCVLGEFRMSFLRVGPTELRIILSAGTLMLLVKPTVTVFGTGPWRLFDVGGVVAVAGLLVALGVSVARHTRTLYRDEPLPSHRYGPREDAVRPPSECSPRLG